MALLPMLRPVNEPIAPYRLPAYVAGDGGHRGWTFPYNPAAYSVDPGTYALAQLGRVAAPALAAIVNPCRWGKLRGLLSGAIPAPISALAPTVASTNPNNGPAAGGTSTIITGTHFIGASAVTFDGVAVPFFIVLSPTQIQVTTPPHAAGAVNVAVTTPTGGTGTGVGVYTYT